MCGEREFIARALTRFAVGHALEDPRVDQTRETGRQQVARAADRAHEIIELKPILDTLLIPRRRSAIASNAPWASRHVLERASGDLVWWSADKGAIVMLVHGWEGSHTDLDAFVAPLLARGYRVVGVDLSAHGESGGDVGSIPIFARDIAELATTLAPEPILATIAHSMGGPSVALALASGMDVNVGGAHCVATSLRTVRTMARTRKRCRRRSSRRGGGGLGRRRGIARYALDRRRHIQAGTHRARGGRPNRRGA